MDKELSKYSGRLNVLFLVLFVGLVILVLRVSYIQLAKGDDYAKKAETNRYAQQVIPAPRGQFKDRNGELLVTNKPAFTIQFTNDDKSIEKQIPTIAKKLTLVLNDGAKEPITEQNLIDLMNGKKDDLPNSTPRKIKVNATEKQVAYVSEHMDELPGISVIPEATRDYPMLTYGAQIFGHMQPILKETWKDYKDKGYLMTDQVGVTGLERQYEQYLKGEKGASRVEVNIHGNPIRGDGLTKQVDKKPVPGDDLVLTIDKKLQMITEDALAAQIQQLKGTVKHAAAVAMDPNTGEVLALASYPSFDPNHWLNGISDKNYALYAPAEMNQVLQAYEPGSVIKMITTMAGLKEGVITPGEKIYDPGYKVIGGSKFKSWSTGLGSVNGKEALEKSSNVYMFTVGMRLAQYDKIGQIGFANWVEQLDMPAVQKFRNYEKEFGIGVKTGIDLPFEQTGDYTYSKDTAINMPFLAIGQNQSVTPIQLAQYVSTLANGGKRLKPFLVKEIVDNSGAVVKRNDPEVLNTISFTPEQLQYVRDGMLMATSDPNGTAYSTFKDKSYKVAGKTGTAETGRNTENYSFVGYAPADKPKIAIAIMIPDGRVGAHSYEMWGPIASKMLDYAMNEPQKPANK